MRARKDGALFHERLRVSDLHPDEPERRDDGDEAPEPPPDDRTGAPALLLGTLRRHFEHGRNEKPENDASEPEERKSEGRTRELEGHQNVPHEGPLWVRGRARPILPTPRPRGGRGA